MARKRRRSSKSGVSGVMVLGAAMESFFRSLKAERVYLTRYASYQEAKTDLFDYIRF